MPRWTEEQVLKTAPDAASVTAARKLAHPGPWSETGSTDTLLWGLCQGSGRTPYQVSVDLTGPAYRCSCPSRKFPCKHGLALLLLWVAGDGSVADSAEAAGFAGDWAEQRAQRAADAAVRTAKPPPDPVAAAKRLELRLALMDAGMNDFSRWLADLVRAGMATARHQPYSWWDAAAARLVDAQLPGLADRVRRTGAEIHSRPDWPEQLLADLGLWWAATWAWTRRAELSAEQFADLRVFVGWPVRSEEIQDSVEDSWLVLGAHRSDDGRLAEQRTWLWGETGHEIVQILDFAMLGQPLPVGRIVGATLLATLSRYPGTPPARARFCADPAAGEPRGDLPAGVDIEAALDRSSRAVVVNPWAGRVPVVLDQVSAAPGHLHDGRHRLSLLPGEQIWSLLAITGGHPATVFGELEGAAIRPLSVAWSGAVIGL